MIHPNIFWKFTHFHLVYNDGETSQWGHLGRYMHYRGGVSKHDSAY